MKQIPLTRNMFVLVDDVDFEYLNQWRWNAVRNGGSIYAARSNPRIYMHRIITNAPKGMNVDHINLNGLDNRRVNLRVCTPAQNSFNHKTHKNNSTGYKGVTYRKHAGRYQANIGINGKVVYLGYFSTPEDAARAYDKAAKQHFGEFAWTNF